MTVVTTTVADPDHPKTEADKIVDGNEAALTNAVLDTYKSSINDYDGWAIFMYVDHEAFAVTQ